MRKKDVLHQIEEKTDEIGRLLEEIRAEARKALEEEEGKDDEKA